MRRPKPLASIATLFALVASSSALQGQCDLIAEPLPVPPGISFPFLISNMNTIMWDPDGSGPQPERLIVAGTITGIDGDPAVNIAMLDPATGHWVTLGTFMNAHRIDDLQAGPNGELVAVTEEFPNFNGTRNLMRWNGTNWVNLNAPQQPFRFALLPSGEIVVLPSTSLNYDVLTGATWSTIPSPAPFPGWTTSLIPYVTPSGKLAAFGHNGVSQLVLEWGGASWSTYATLPVSSADGLLAFKSNGDAVAVGGSSGNVSCVGSTVLPMSNHLIRGLHVQPNDDVVLFGFFSSFGTTTTERIARFDGTTVQSIGAGIQIPWGSGVYNATTLTSGELLAQGVFPTVNGVNYRGLARFDGTAWVPFRHASVSGTITSAAVVSNSMLFVAGDFDSAGGTPVANIAAREGNFFVPLGSGTDGPIASLAALPSGDLVVGGAFSVAGGVSANGIATWDGAAWSALGSGTNGAVTAVTTTASGDVYASGAFSSAGGVAANGIARWDGSNWSPLGAGIDGPANVLRVEGSDLLVGGAFATAGGATADNVARWDGTNWHALAGGVDGEVHAMTRLANGELAVGGALTGGVATWNGTQWASAGSGLPTTEPVRALHALEDGSYLATHADMAGTTYSVSRWDGSNWLDRGQLDGAIYTFAELGGELLIAGDFRETFGELTGNVAKISFPCTATVSVLPAGACLSPNAPTLAASQAPWLGSSVNLQVDNLTTPGFAVALFGYQGTLTDLSGVLGLPSPCFLVSSIDTSLAFVSTDPLTVPLSVPNSPVLVGALLRSYVASIELGPGGAIAQSKMSNGLALRIGTY